MKKTILIIQREFLSRVQKKSFLVATILVPLIFPALIGGIGYMMVKEEENAKIRLIHVLDEKGTFNPENTDEYKFVKLDTDLETAKTAFTASEAYALLYLPDYSLEDPHGFTLYSKNNPNFSILKTLESEIEKAIKDNKLRIYGIDKGVLDKLKTEIDLRSVNISEGQETESNAGISFGVGYFTGFLIYIFMFAYGGQVMQGVMEEKNSKVVEIILSSVKPFQLMLGKILGVASVGFFQVLIWVMLVTVLSTTVLGFLGLDLSHEQAMPAGNEIESVEFLRSLADIPFATILLTFLFYFIGGLFLYGSLFAAVGSAVDSPSEAQQFMVPIMIPLLAGIVGMGSIISNPEGNLSFWLSMIPFTSPIAMMGRIGFGVPAWQLALSMVLLIAGFIFTTWIAGRIYRIGILMHGAKVNYKTLAKWFMIKN